MKTSSDVIGTVAIARRRPRENRGPRDVGGPRTVDASRTPRSIGRRRRPRACPAVVSARRPCATRSSTSACRRCARATSPWSSWGRWRPSIRCTCGSASNACSYSSRSWSAPEAIFTEYAYFSSYSDSWVAHARDYVTSVVERFGLGRTARWSSWPATTATCSNTSSSAAYPRWESSPLPTSRRQPGNGDRDRRRVLRQGARVPPRCRRPRGGPADRQQRIRSRPRPERTS